MVSIGHELTQAVELLDAAGVVDSDTAHNFYQRTAAIERYNVETQAAIEIELKVDKDLRTWGRHRAPFRRERAPGKYAKNRARLRRGRN